MSSSTTRGPPLSPCIRRGSLVQRSSEVTWQASPRRPLVLALLSSSPRAHSSLVSPSLVTRAGKLGTEVTGVTVSLARCYLAPHSPGLSTATLVDCSRVEVGPPGEQLYTVTRITYH